MMKRLFSWQTPTEEKDFFINRKEKLESKIQEQSRILSSRRELGKKLGIDDETTLCILQEVGFNTESADLIYFIPSILLAWNKGSLTDKQMQCIQSLIKDSNIKEDNDIYDILIKMKDEYPCEKVSMAALRAIRIKLEKSTEIEKEKTKKSLSHFSRILGVNIGRKINFGLNTSNMLRSEIELISSFF